MVNEWMGKTKNSRTLTTKHSRTNRKQKSSFAEEDNCFFVCFFLVFFLFQ